MKAIIIEKARFVGMHIKSEDVDLCLDSFRNRMQREDGADQESESVFRLGGCDAKK